jgi:hypothetical protein
MIIYSATKSQFCEAVMENRIGAVVKTSFRQHMGFDPSPNEAQAFQNSIPYVGNVLAGSALADDVGVAIEYRIPQSSKRIDFVITGRNQEGSPVAVIIELKQWTDVESTTMDAVVRTWLGGKDREVLHPSYQAWSYAPLGARHRLRGPSTCPPMEVDRDTRCQLSSSRFFQRHASARARRLKA